MYLLSCVMRGFACVLRGSLLSGVERLCQARSAAKLRKHPLCTTGWLSDASHDACERSWDTSNGTFGDCLARRPGRPQRNDTEHVEAYGCKGLRLQPRARLHNPNPHIMEVVAGGEVMAQGRAIQPGPSHDPDAHNRSGIADGIWAQAPPHAWRSSTREPCAGHAQVRPALHGEPRSGAASPPRAPHEPRGGPSPSGPTG